MTRATRSRRSLAELALRIESTNAADLACLHPWFDTAARSLPRSIRHAMRVALEEAVMNAAMHGFPPNISGEITVRLGTTQDAAVLTVEDVGCRFDASVTPPARESAEIEPGGLGLILLHHYCDDLVYERVGERNRLTMRFPLQSAA